MLLVVGVTSSERFVITLLLICGSSLFRTFRDICELEICKLNV